MKFIIVYFVIHLSIIFSSFSDDLKVKIPSTYEELKKAYLIFVDLYINERKDFIILKEELNKSKEKIEELTFQIEKLNINNIKITEEYEKVLKKRYSNFRCSLLTSIDYTFFKDFQFSNTDKIKNKINVNLGGGVCIYNWFALYMYIRVPDFGFGLAGVIQLTR